MPNQTDPNQVADTASTPPVSVQHTDLPPLPDFMNVPPSPTPQTTPPADDSSGSAAPSDLPPVMATPKKKFGGGKIIATILGLVLLVGGVGAGVVLTQQQQLFQPKATGSCSCSLTNAATHECTANAGSTCGNASCNYQERSAANGGPYCSCGCSPYITCIGNQVQSCGTCGNGTQTCNNNAWGPCSCGETPTCTSPNTLCGTNCVNLQTDSSNCGSCGHSCGGAGCNNGSCTSSGGDRSCTTINTFQCNGDLHEICRNTASGLKWSTYEDCTLTTQTCGTKNDGSLGCIPKSGGGNTCTCVNASVTANSCTTQSNAHCTQVNTCSCTPTTGGTTCSGNGNNGGALYCSTRQDCSGTGKVAYADKTGCTGTYAICCENVVTGSCAHVGCSGSGCSAGGVSGCYVNHYWCQGVSGYANGCSETLLESHVASASFSKDCGTEQIDVQCPTCGPKYLSITHPSACSGGTPPPGTPAPGAPMCLAVKAYDTSWNLFTTAQLSALKAGDKVRFTVAGSPADQIDKAQFAITAMVGEVNQGTPSGDVTAKKPGTDEYFYEYTIPDGTKSVSVTGQVHHSTLGWF